LPNQDMKEGGRDSVGTKGLGKKRRGQLRVAENRNSLERCSRPFRKDFGGARGWGRSNHNIGRREKIERIILGGGRIVKI